MICYTCGHEQEAHVLTHCRVCYKRRIFTKWFGLHKFTPDNLKWLEEQYEKTLK